jgi:hypothetical protein
LELEIFLKRTPACHYAKQGYEQVPFPEKSPEENKQYVYYQYKGVGDTNKGKYPDFGGTDVYGNVGQEQRQGQ